MTDRQQRILDAYREHGSIPAAAAVLDIDKRQVWAVVNRDRHLRSLRSNELRKRTGITLDQYEEIYRRQGGRCAACGEHRSNGGPAGLYADHDHRTGTFRGLLCPRCNTIAGAIEDSRFHQVQVYLAKGNPHADHADRSH